MCESRHGSFGVRVPARAEAPASGGTQRLLHAYGTLRAQGYAPERIGVTGDSTGGAPALALATALRDQEILLSDSLRLASHANACGLRCTLEVHAGRWHVFQLQSFYLRSARDALRTLAAQRARAAGQFRSPDDARHTITERDTSWQVSGNAGPSVA